jgi:DNA-binding transcriptional LysR family regulator
MQARHPLRGVDLNLLPLLQVLLEEHSVTRAARRLGLSQSATSRALGRLREQLDDEVLVRVGSTLVPTPRAASLQVPLARVLDDVVAVIMPPAPFDPCVSERTFRVGTADYGEFVVLPALRDALERAGAKVRVAAMPIPEDPSEALAMGHLDVIVMPRRSTVAGVVWRPLWRDPFVVVCRADHPRVRDALTLDGYCSEAHVLVSPGARGGPGQVDRELEALGRAREVAMTVSGFLAAQVLVARSELITTTLARVAESVGPELGLRVFPAPLDLPEVSVDLGWHERMRKDQGHRWFRQQVVAVMHHASGPTTP